MHISSLWRHPIKGVGREEIANTFARLDQCMDWDRHWAIAHEAAQIDFDTHQWERCMNFARAARGHSLQAADARLDGATGEVSLSHPNQPSLTVNPDDPAQHATLIEWVTAISDPKRAMPKSVHKAPRGMTDSSSATFSIQTMASLRDLEKALGQSLDTRRFRGNIWIEDANAWDEFSWLGKDVQIGEAVFHMTKPIERCVATTVNPETGVSDRATLSTLNSVYGHQNFGVLGRVIQEGNIATGDVVKVL